MSLIVEVNIGETAKYVFTSEIDLEKSKLEIFNTWRHVNPQLFFQDIYSISKISITHTTILDTYTLQSDPKSKIPLKKLLTLDYIPIHR